MIFTLIFGAMLTLMAAGALLFLVFEAIHEKEYREAYTAVMLVLLFATFVSLGVALT